MRGKRNILIDIAKIGLITMIQQTESIGSKLIITHFIKQIDKLLIALTENLIKFDIYRRILTNNLRMKEIWSFVITTQQIPLLTYTNRRQLIHIANKNYLNTTKWFVRTKTIVTQHCINSIKHIGTHH